MRVEALAYLPFLDHADSSPDLFFSHPFASRTRTASILCDQLQPEMTLMIVIVMMIMMIVMIVMIVMMIVIMMMMMMMMMLVIVMIAVIMMVMM